VQVASITANPHGMAESELKEAIQTLKQEEVIVEQESGKRIVVPDRAQDGSYKHFAHMYYMLLYGTSDPSIFGLPFYDIHINEQLLDVIRDTQVGVPLSPDNDARRLSCCACPPRHC